MDQTEIEIEIEIELLFQTVRVITKTSVISSASNNRQTGTHSPEQYPDINRQRQANENEQDFMKPNQITYTCVHYLEK
jgi:hypothetical protein